MKYHTQLHKLMRSLQQQHISEVSLKELIIIQPLRFNFHHEAVLSTDDSSLF